LFRWIRGPCTAHGAAGLINLLAALRELLCLFVPLPSRRATQFYERPLLHLVADVVHAVSLCRPPTVPLISVDLRSLEFRRVTRGYAKSGGSFAHSGSQIPCALW
jgi:hypothetical protein